jgi:hypothetical protein
MQILINFYVCQHKNLTALCCKNLINWHCQITWISALEVKITDFNPLCSFFYQEFRILRKWYLFCDIACKNDYNPSCN